MLSTTSPSSSPRLTLSVAEAAHRLGVPLQTVRGWIRHGVVPSLKIGRRRLLRVADIEQIVACGPRREAEQV